VTAISVRSHFLYEVRSDAALLATRSPFCVWNSRVRSPFSGRVQNDRASDDKPTFWFERDMMHGEKADSIGSLLQAKESYNQSESPVI
jgi:hypothetical protein